jgi:hypothetical protein
MMPKSKRIDRASGDLALWMERLFREWRDHRTTGRLSFDLKNGEPQSVEKLEKVSAKT